MSQTRPVSIYHTPLNPPVFHMQDKTMANALPALHAKIIRANPDRLDHVNARLVTRDVDLGPRDPKRGRDSAAYAAEHSGMTQRQASSAWISHYMAGRNRAGEA